MTWQDLPPSLTHSAFAPASASRCDAAQAQATMPPPTAIAAHVSWKVTITSQSRRAQLASAAAFAARSSAKEYDQPTAPVDWL